MFSQASSRYEAAATVAQTSAARRNVRVSLSRTPPQHMHFPSVSTLIGGCSRTLISSVV
jgi:hypothetical protein